MINGIDLDLISRCPIFMTNEQNLKNLVRLEIADKSTKSTIAFSVFALFIFFYSFGCTRFELVIKSCMLMIIAVSIMRFFQVKRIMKSGFVSTKDWYLLVLFVWMNALFWSMAFSFASFELKLSGIHFIVVTTMLAGFVAASLITLAYDSLLFLPFQFFLLVPQMGIITYFYFGPDKINSLPLIPIYIMYLIYQLRQFKDFKSQSVQRLSYQLELELSNEELQKSQVALINQTIKLVHTSRLAALGEMSAGIAHEVNNPLAIISGSIQQIEKMSRRENIDIEKILKLTERSQFAIERVTKIIKGLRHFSQQSDSLPKNSTKLHDIIQDTVSFCSEMLSARYIKLQIDQPPDVEVECNPVQISQVLINLIKNAEDAMEMVPTEDERWIKVSFVLNEDYVSVSVVNGGPTIQKEIQEKLFQPFFTTKMVGKGTGLGLSISQGIMREHNGDLVFDQTANNTTFILQLPCPTNVNNDAAPNLIP